MLQEQLQAERDLRAALEVGLSMSSSQFSSSRAMDTKVPLVTALLYGITLRSLIFTHCFSQDES
jgi:hypothetical protein